MPACRLRAPACQRALMRLCALLCFRTRDFRHLRLKSRAGAAAVTTPGSFGSGALACVASTFAALLRSWPCAWERLAAALFLLLQTRFGQCEGDFGFYLYVLLEPRVPVVSGTAVHAFIAIATRCFVDVCVSLRLSVSSRFGVPRASMTMSSCFQAYCAMYMCSANSYGAGTWLRPCGEVF